MMGAAPAHDCRSPAVDEDDVGRRLGGGESINRWPPGVRFHPTDEELVLFYLKRKICRRRIKPSMIGDVDVYKWEPWELPEKSVLRRGDKQWFFFSPRDRKYPNGSRSNRATKHGYWKATGKDRTISHSSKAAGNKKTLVFYRGRAPRGERTDWVMHEYTLDEQLLISFNNAQDSYALYKLFLKSGPGPKNGEQYGAPFIEEEWDDDAVDEGFMDQNDVEDVSAINQSGNSVPCAFGGEEDCNALLANDRDVLLLKLLNGQDIIQGHPEISSYASDISKIDFEPEFGSQVTNPFRIDTDCNIHGGNWCEMSSMGTSFHNMQSVETHPEPIGLPDIAASQHIVAADEEFLEIKDLDDPETSYFLDDISSRNPVFDTEDQFYDPYDQFDDANIYLSGSIDLPIHDGKQSHLLMDGFFDEDLQNHESLFTSELWTHEDTSNLLAVANTNQVVIAPPAASGLDYTNDLPSTVKALAEDISHYDESSSQSWISNALSAFIDSVPSSPALASERALISKAIERVSSFRAATANALEGNAASGGHSGGSIGRQPAYNRGFLFISVLVGIGAVFWVLTIGAAFKVCRGLWGIFISS